MEKTGRIILLQNDNRIFKNLISFRFIKESIQATKKIAFYDAVQNRFVWLIQNSIHTTAVIC